ncbi:hypothetical protein UFOVP118_79 [uncultured Caudovirales phage]|uniref:Uncharacterized protein n=1 Tax=uncultured Caudovirales phage TaxID=2100421 RepID=A0A6J5L661_9CAUD|nr:hypothetical protein UFOVP118_79 [uncultured Caudovirales phage]
MSVVALTVPLELADGGIAYTGSATGLGDLFVVNTTGYNSISVQLSGTWVGTVSFKASNDGINWTTIATATTNGLYIYPTTGIYFKAEVTAYTSGEIDALAYLRFQQVADITIDADLANIDTNTAATAANTAQANVYLQSIANDIGETTTPIVATATANGTLFTTDTLGYETISVQLSGDWQANCVFQVSNDNVTFANVQGYTFNNYMNSINTAQDNGVYIFPVTGRYFRVTVSNYNSGTVSCTSYLRSQSLAGIGETMLTQAMDQSNNTPINVNYQNTGQKPAAASVPVTLSDENILDKYITGRAFTQTSTYLNYNMLLDAKDSAINPSAPLDCLQYRSIYFQFNSGGTNSAGNTASASFIPEMSNDLVNWVTAGVYNLAAGTSVGISEVTSINPVNYGSFSAFGASLTMRYFRLRCSGFASNAFIQWTTVLRMTPFTNRNESITNILQQGGSGLSGGTASFNSGAQTVSTGLGASMSNAIAPILIGGSDRSIVKAEMIGAPIGATPTYGLNGPWARQANYDIAGAGSVGGVNPLFSEDKTYPVNVRLERTTQGQDSVQDLLQQVLVELRALNYYTRETPNALNSGLMVSLQDDPENFADDQNTSRLQKGH